MKKLVIKALSLSLSLLFVQLAHADLNTYTLTFDEDWSNDDKIPQTYGDEALIDVSYDVKTAFGEATSTDQDILFWDDEYSDLTNVAWANVWEEDAMPLAVAEITFAPANGYQAVLESFDLGFWPYNGGDDWASDSYDQQSEVRIYNADYSALLWSAQDIIGTELHQGFAPSLIADGTVHLQWLNPWYVAIDNVTYGVSKNGPPTDPVPEPSTILLLLSGMGALGLKRRKK